jgi:hypothetical protein
VGDAVEAGQPLATLVYADCGLDEAQHHLKAAIHLES